MARRVDHALHDILQAIERVEQITEARTLTEFEASWQLQWLVQRALEVISEASRAIPESMKAEHPEIPWERVKGIGNVLRHEYQGISDPLIWNVVLDELPRLKTAVEAMRTSARDNEGD
jgi:uncharacterized protein with HEPN domain